jgi:hypothetical protein
MGGVHMTIQEQAGAGEGPVAPLPVPSVHQYIPPNQDCVLAHVEKGLYFHKIGKSGGFAWMPLEQATVLPRRKWMVAEGERLVPVRLMPIPVDLESPQASREAKAEPAPNSSNPSPRAGGWECWVKMSGDYPTAHTRPGKFFSAKEGREEGFSLFREVVEPLPVEKGRECLTCLESPPSQFGRLCDTHYLEAKSKAPSYSEIPNNCPALPWEALDKLRDLGEDICVEHCEPLDSGSEKHCSWCKQIADIRKTLKGETRHG